MTNAYVVAGTIADPQTVRLSEPLPVDRGEVRVVVEVVGSPSARHGSLQDFLADIHRRRSAAGVPPLTAEQIEEWVRDVIDARGD